ncbi:SpoIID/LytB domain-containing protein [Cyanobium sp. Cruz-8D1]|nr:SpoIID/LytB domain-containing protein [Cyanobium sp. Cruz-8H5]MCP9865618.1 SpoIID/LytB domain-containing protein [Cyanobium sp. Cruz-8D1]
MRRPSCARRVQGRVFRHDPTTPSWNPAVRRHYAAAFAALRASGRRLLQGCRRHPILLTAPLAVVAVGAGFAAQDLLPGPRSAAQPDLLEALIAQPREVSQSSATAAESPDKDLLAATSLRAQRTSLNHPDPSLVEPEAGPEVPLEIRVALLGASPSPQLGASGYWRLVDRDGRAVQDGGPDASPDLGAAMAARAEVWLETGSGHVLSVDGRPYEGRLRVLRGPRGLQLVNHVSLERYISSVVGAEMPSSWQMEALKAQAVAARSYAMAHMARPASAHWHLGDTTRWQAYRGLGSVNPRTRQATSSTSGVILSYQGGIVESLYAATTRITQEAHGHLGASMSQHGAQDLAEQGLRYNEILGRYYQGASLARLQAGAS